MNTFFDFENNFSGFGSLSRVFSISERISSRTRKNTRQGAKTRKCIPETGQLLFQQKKNQCFLNRKIVLVIGKLPSVETEIFLSQPKKTCRTSGQRIQTRKLLSKAKKLSGIG